MSRVGARGVMALAKIAEPREQLREREWCGQVIVPTLFQPPYSIVHRASCRQDQHRSVHSEFTESEDQADTVLIGQTKINNQGVVSALNGKTLCCLAISRSFHLISSLS